MEYNYPFPADIAEMKARGYEHSAIAEAEAQWSACEPVYRAIERAFANVTLANGVGLSEGEAIDDYADAATRASYRANDEQQDWKRIPPAALYRYNASLSFFDAEGMRFHLPAFLIAHLHGDDLLYPLLDDLLDLNDLKVEQYALLNGEQRGAVAAFLRLLGPGHPRVIRALDEYWDKEPSPLQDRTA